MIIRRATPADCEILLDRWLRSVQATHTFVSAQDIEGMTPHVRTYLSSEAELWVPCDDAGTAMGFMGVSEGRIDSMFLAPQFMGRGIGRQMVRHAQSQWADLTVDVNEQNEGACRFYQACGFVVTGRSELDEQERPYPLLHMQLVAPTLVRGPDRS
ncbi:MAG TPA: acetyltransferase [Steroidobacteraceae bacterium]|jgi:putative acetyltransferase|nr:acetyltransferase [Steroidobacteraceae bacterium]